jgi:hypothetical protein
MMTGLQCQTRHHLEPHTATGAACSKPNSSRCRLSRIRSTAARNQPIQQALACQHRWRLLRPNSLQCHHRQWYCRVAAAAAQEVVQQSAEWTATRTLDEDQLETLAEQFDRFDVDQCVPNIHYYGTGM